jgi:hypothetical protein
VKYVETKIATSINYWNIFGAIHFFYFRC